MPLQERNGEAMQHKALANSETDPVRLDHVESELQPQVNPDTPRRGPQIALQPGSQPLTVRAKAMAANGPGSEYWLP